MKNILNYFRKNIYAIPFAVSVSIILNIMIDFIGFTSMDVAFQEANETLAGFGVYTILFLVFIFAPITEELIFRKLIFRLARRFFRFIIAAFISALLFGIAHLNITQFIYAFILGFILCYGYEVTNTITTPIFMHAFSNLFVVIINGTIVASNMNFINKIFVVIIFIAVAYMSWYRWHEINNMRFNDIIKRKKIKTRKTIKMG